MAHVLAEGRDVDMLAYELQHLEPVDQPQLPDLAPHSAAVTSVTPGEIEEVSQCVIQRAQERCSRHLPGRGSRRS